MSDDERMQHQNEKRESMQFKYILIGDVAVGKSSLLRQFIDRRFLQDYHITIGVEFNSKSITVDETIIKLQIWDTTGQENFKSVTRLYYRAAAGAIMVFDLTRRETFQNIVSWYNEAKTNGNPYMKFLLVGNKSDIEDQRSVQFNEAQQLALSNNFEYMETSAKNGNNVEEAFLNLSYQIYQDVMADYQRVDQKYGIKLLQPIKDHQNLPNSPRDEDYKQKKPKESTRQEHIPISSAQITKRNNIEQEQPKSQRQIARARQTSLVDEKEYKEYYETQGEVKLSRPPKQSNQNCQCCADQ